MHAKAASTNEGFLLTVKLWDRDFEQQNKIVDDALRKVEAYIRVPFNGSLPFVWEQLEQ